ncbi:hypothetical protein ONE63_011151 [Megalurothrips usitatus]|uniref:Glycoprotein n=1 Tax=Megalurothrips usitatus TaxID=439358 RepID=A0AAV7XF59_9NEOP|nr:hypothetical protein ONE63_011151 [Megalurothrips usitatus]
MFLPLLLLYASLVGCLPPDPQPDSEAEEPRFGAPPLLVGYSCDHPATNMTQISLSEVGECSLQESDGKCENGLFVDEGKQYPDSLVHVMATISVFDYTAKVDLGNNVVHLKDGLQCPYPAMTCRDFWSGHTFWNAVPISTDCETESHMILYEGEAKLFTSQNELTEDKYVIVDNIMETFALRLSSSFDRCGIKMYTTDHSQIIVSMVPERKYFFFKGHTALAFDNTLFLANFHSKLQYLEWEMKTNLQKLNLYGAYRRCLLERDIIRHKLALIRTSPSNAGSILFDNPSGVLVHHYGELAVVLRCVEVVVSYRHDNSCWSSLPITYKQQPAFLQPVSRVITPHADAVVCSRMNPISFRMNQKDWFGFSPLATPLREPPVVLQPFQEVGVSFDTIRHVAGKGLFAFKDLEEFQRSIMFPNARTAVESTFATKVLGNTVVSTGFSALSLFSKGELRKLATSTLENFWAFVNRFGLLASTVIGVMTILNFIKLPLPPPPPTSPHPPSPTSPLALTDACTPPSLSPPPPLSPSMTRLPTLRLCRDQS